MPPCGSFSHDLLALLGRSTFDGMKVVRCTIVALDPKNNTVDVELGEDPPTVLYAGELRDTDCSSIPSFAGDGWSADEERRRFNDVPIFYHCQGSTGTVNELRTGHMAFRVPPIELTTPPWSAGTVAENHAVIIREKVYMVYIPPTVAEAAGGSLGHRYVVGHSDRNDIAPCRTEFICFRIHDQFDVETEIEGVDNPNFGHSDPAKTIVAIVDPVGQRLYDGLEEFGVTFPCTAQSILDKVAAIDLGGDPTDEEIAFLDKLHLVEPLYPSAFVFQAPFWYVPFTTYVNFYLDPDGHEYYPERLHWLTHFYDYGLQCEPNADPRLMDEPYSTCYVWHNYSMDMDNEVPGVAIPETEIDPIPVMQNIDVRSYELLSGGLYRTTFADMNDNEVDHVPPATVSSVAGTPYSCDGHTCTDYEVTYENWIYHPANELHAFGFYQWGPWHPQASFMTVSGTTTFTATSGLYSTTSDFEYDYQVKLYAPWQAVQEVSEFSPWYEFSGNTAAITPYINSDAAAFGRQGCYGISAFVHGGPEEFISRALFSYNQDAYYGDTNLRQVSYFRPLPGASDYLSTMLDQMWAMHYATGPTGNSIMTAFVIDVLEE